MKQAMSDRVVDKLVERLNTVRVKLHKDFKNTKPFRQEEVTPEEEIFWYRDLSPEDAQFLVQKHGYDKVMVKFNKIEKLIERRGL